MEKSIFIIGSGGHAVSVANVAMSIGYKIIACVDDNNIGNKILGAPVIGTSELTPKSLNTNFCVAIGDNAIREKVYKEYKEMFPEARFPVLVHQSSIIGEASVIGEGTVVMPMVNIGPNTNIGSCCIVNSSTSLDHDCRLENYSSVAPGVICGGCVHIGKRSAISIGAIVKHNISIGEDVVVGASSYVDESIENGVVSYGTPSKKIRDRKKGDPYLS